MNKKEMIEKLKEINPFSIYGWKYLNQRTKKEVQDLYNEAQKLGLLGGA